MGNFFNNLSAKLQTFMMGRNGVDTLVMWTIGAAVIFTVLQTFIPIPIFFILSYALLFLFLFRMLSTNIPARQAENQKFEDILGKFKFGKSKGRGNNPPSPNSRPVKKAQDPTKLKITCEQCGQSLSVPKGRGTLKVTCPKCHHQMKVKS